MKLEVGLESDFSSDHTPLVVQNYDFRSLHIVTSHRERDS
jgi:hypothetical protein